MNRLALALCLTASVASADAPRLAGPVLHGDGQFSLLGTSGEVFAPVGDAWQRTERGGVAVTVQAGFQSTGGRFFAVGVETPLFERVDGVWSARPLPNRGDIRVATGGAKLIAIGRHLYRLDDKWRRVASAPRRIAALWSSDGRQVVAATVDGSLWRFRGKRRSKIRLSDFPLADDDGFDKIYGRHASDLLAVTNAGQLRHIRAQDAVAVQPPGASGGLAVEAGATADGSLLLLVRDPSGETKALQFANGTLTEASPLPEALAGARVVTMFSASKDTLFVVTQAGQLLARSTEGWQSKDVRDALPALDAPKSSAPARGP